MKIFNKYLWMLMGVILCGLSTGCTDDVEDSLSEGVRIKAFLPSAVMENTELIISGSNLNEVTAVIFPEEITVDRFELVSPNMIKVNVPAGVGEGKLRLVTNNGVVESSQSMRPAKPQIKSMEPGDQINALEVLTFKGEDLEFINKIIFPGKEGENIEVEAMSFLRKSSGHLKVRVPASVVDGLASVTLVADNGDELVSNEITFIAGKGDAAGSVKAYINHVGSGRYLTRNTAEDYPRVMSYTGSRDQEFSFVPVDGMPGKYYLKNSATGEFLVIGDENDWRMIWVFDPTTITYPERGMYEVVNVGDNVQIKNVGSGNLGTDSNDENSEVYGNKWGETEPRFLWKLEIVSGTFDVPGSGYTEVLWEGSAELSWDGSTAPAIDGAKCGNIIAGDKIVLTFSYIGDAGGWPSCYIRSASNAELTGTGLWDYSGKDMPFEVAIEIPYDLAVVKGFKEGFYLVGTGATLSQVAVQHTGDPSIEIPEGDNVLYFTPNPFLISWDAAVEISKDKFANLTAGQYINISVTAFEEGQDWPQLRVTSNWNEITYIALTDEPYNKGIFPFNASFQVTEDHLALMKENGLRIDGVGAFINMVTFDASPQ